MLLWTFDDRPLLALGTILRSKCCSIGPEIGILIEHGGELAEHFKPEL